jgi:hypothetical protein
MTTNIVCVTQIDPKYGLPDTSAKDVAAFVKNQDFIGVGTNILCLPETEINVLEKHKQKQRCFLYVLILPKKGKLEVQASAVITLDNFNKIPFVRDDKIFLSYVQKYDMEFMLPVFFKSTGNIFQASIVMAPWGDPEKIKKALLDNL